MLMRWSSLVSSILALLSSTKEKVRTNGCMDSLFMLDWLLIKLIKQLHLMHGAVNFITCTVIANIAD